MPQIFRPVSNLTWKLVAISLFVLVVGTALVAEGLKYSTYIVKEGLAISQPIPFSHKHHAGELGIDCRYCHTSVEKSSFAGMPSTHTCMTCHSQIWSESEMLKPVRESYRKGIPIRWERVTRMPHYVYFDHSAHVKSGIGCETCHGNMNEMPITWRHRSFYMVDCLSCHTHPGPQLRPADQIFNMNWHPPEQDQERKTLAQKLMIQYRIKSTRKLVDCYVCHR